MTTIKTFLFNRFNILFPLFILTTLSILLLSVRLKLTHSFFFLFLVWNLFLAMVPYFISSFITARKQWKPWELYSLLIVWLLFLPNSPYLVTDFIHLRLSPSQWLIYDAFVFMLFAVTGLAFYMFSIRDIFDILKVRFRKKIVSKFIFALPFLVSFGIYLGRVLRWNSWDLIHKPSGLFADIFIIVSDPIDNLDAWRFTILFGLFLKLGQWIIDKFSFGYLKS